jgi:Holliday junction resolvase
MSERAIVDRIRRLLQKRGAWFVKTTGVSVAGIPDLICCHRGFFIAIEVKQPGRHPTPAQRHQLDSVTRAHGLAIVATSPHQVAEQLDRIDQESRP